MHESQENNLLQGEQWRNAPMQKQRGLPRALALLWRGGVLALSTLWGTVALPHLVCDVRAVCGLWPAL